ncbi:MAG: virulence RhuM family protein [Methanobrevibacter sp.]|nr:virulence RhuM family protein [Candidatus Methanovirga aequatorialis]
MSQEFFKKVQNKLHFAVSKNCTRDNI